MQLIKHIAYLVWQIATFTVTSAFIEVQDNQVFVWILEEENIISINLKTFITINQAGKGHYTSFFYNTINKLCCYEMAVFALISFMCKVLYQLHKWIQKSECTKCEIFFNANSIFLLFKWVLLVSVINKFQWFENFGTLQ